MATTPTPRPVGSLPAGEQLTFTVFNDIGLWVTYTTDDDLVILEKAWINGEWIDARALFGEEQYLAWCNAVQADREVCADALAESVLETLPAFEASMVRAQMRRAA